MKAIIFSHSLIRRDPRLLRQIRWLTEIGYDSIVTIGNGTKADGVEGHFPIPVLSLPARYFGYLIRGHRKRFDYFFGSHLDKIPEGLFEKADLLVVNEIEYLAWGGFQREGLVDLPLYLDLHEDHVNAAYRGPLEAIAFKEYWEWQLLMLHNFVEKRQGPIRVSSVEEVIASDYERMLSRPVELIRNAPDNNSLSPSQVVPDEIKLVHHGMGTKGRGIELTIRALSNLDPKFHLTLILFSTPQFRLKIEALAWILGVRKRVRILPGVPLAELPATLNRFDVSIVVLPDDTPGHANALPNKFFESIHSKLAIVTGPNATMSRLVREEGIGIAMETWNWKELVTSLEGLTPIKIAKYKQNAVKSARSMSSVQSSITFKRLIRELAGRSD